MQSPETSVAPAGDAPRDTRLDDARGRLVLGLPRIPGWRGELLILGFFVLATLVLTWPIVITMGQGTGLRGDYFNNLWNVWWLERALGEGVSPFHTDFLYWPEGLSLWRHTLSPVNALAGVVLSTFLGPEAVFNTILLGNFALSAWVFSLFARYATGSLGGSVLAGMLYSFNPFHYYYLCQVNVFSLEWLPLALLFFVRVYREGGRRNMIGAALATGLITGSAEYYVMYAVIVVGLMLVFGRLLDREVDWIAGVKRLLVTGALTGVVVALVGFPLLYGTFGPESANANSDLIGFQGRRANDLLGFEWVGGPEVLTVSWPTMLGYSTLLVLALSLRRLLARQRFWLVVGLVFFLLGLGKELTIAREPTGIPLVYQLLGAVPGLEMLRKPDRAFLMVLFVASLCLAEAWVGLRERLASEHLRRAAWCVLFVLPMAELTGVPFARFDYRAPAYLETLAADAEVATVFECPPMSIDVMNARYSYYQMTHGKKQPLGYSTLLARGKPQDFQMAGIVNQYLWWISRSPLGNPVPEFAPNLPTWIREQGFDRVLMYKTMPNPRPPLPLHETVVYRPFFLVKDELVGMRQTGQYVDTRIEDLAPGQIFQLKSLLRREFGNPIHEDDDLVVYDPRSKR